MPLFHLLVDGQSLTFLVPLVSDGLSLVISDGDRLQLTPPAMLEGLYEGARRGVVDRDVSTYAVCLAERQRRSMAPQLAWHDVADVVMAIEPEKLDVEFLPN